MNIMVLRSSFQESTIMKSDLFHRTEGTILSRQRPDTELAILGDNSVMRNLRTPEETLSRKPREN
jgi:hypothetical protein